MRRRGEGAVAAFRGVDAEKKKIGSKKITRHPHRVMAPASLSYFGGHAGPDPGGSGDWKNFGRPFSLAGLRANAPRDTKPATDITTIIIKGFSHNLDAATTTVKRDHLGIEAAHVGNLVEAAARKAAGAGTGAKAVARATVAAPSSPGLAGHAPLDSSDTRHGRSSSKNDSAGQVDGMRGGGSLTSKGLAGRGGTGAGAASGRAAPSRVGDAVESAGAAGTTQDDDRDLALALALSLEAGEGPVPRDAATGGGACSAPRMSLPGSAALKPGPEGPAQRRRGPGPPFVRRTDGTPAEGSGGGGAASTASHAKGPLPPAGVGSRRASAGARAEVRVRPSDEDADSESKADKVKVKTLDGEGASGSTGAPPA